MISHAHLPSTLPCLRPCLRGMPSSRPATYGCCCFYSKSLELGFIMATRGATMMIVEIDSQTFPLIRFIIRGKSKKMKVSQSPLEELRKRPGLGERDSSKFLACEEQTYFRSSLRKERSVDRKYVCCSYASKFSALQGKIPHTGNARLHCL